jgi:acyl-homoserine lactone acylase PvdQ
MRSGWFVLLTGLLLGASCTAIGNDVELSDRQALAERVTIYRDAWGVAHVDAKDDPSAAFGFMYAQAEDNFWQVEDTCILGLGRYAEVYGVKGRDEDLLNRAFRIVPEAQGDFVKLDERTQRFCNAAAQGINHYLATHPEVEPRLITRFEGWHFLAISRHVFMTFQLLTKQLPHQYMGKGDPSVPVPIMGSNAWAIGPSRTKDGTTILFCNPHQPQFGYGQMYEGHVRSGEGWDMTGATFPGGPIPAMGHNEYLGWSHTVNRPGNVSFWVVKFDDPAHPNRYRWGDGYKEADVWKATLLVKKGPALVQETETFRATVHGPIIGKISETDYVAIGMARLNEAVLIDQHLRVVRAKSLRDFKNAMCPLDLNIFNTVYADREGNIYFVYNGPVPRRDPRFDWSRKLDGSDPRTQWQAIHDFDELPQLENPPCGWIQSCNSSPYTSTDDGSPLEINYPAYMADDRYEDCLRTKVSRYILRDLKDATLESVAKLAFDTRLYWAMVEIPKYIAAFPALESRDADLAAKVKPILAHLADWDYRNTLECTQSTLVEEWYRQMYETIYPPEGRMRHEYAVSQTRRFEALVTAAAELTRRHGGWQIPWGDVHRLQRHSGVADLIAVPFSDKKPSLPCAGVPGGLGAIMTQYYTPSISIPLVRESKKHYAVLGTTYIAVFEFSKSGVRGQSLINFGASADENSPHYFDQAQLHSQRQLRPSLFDWSEIRREAKAAYHPGQREKK